MLGRRLVAVLVGVTLIAGCGGGSDEPSEASSETSAPAAPTPESTSPPTTGDGGADSITLPDTVGMDLQAAQDTLQAAGFFLLRSHDATGQDRYQVLDRNWTVCDQSPLGNTPAGSDAQIDLGAVKDEERCP